MICRVETNAAALPGRTGGFTRIETLPVGEFSVDLCRREDGAFGLGEIRRGTLPLRRADSLITGQVYVIRWLARCILHPSVAGRRPHGYESRTVASDVRHENPA